MEWLADHRLVYLPVGVGSYLEFRCHDLQLHAISLMEKHTNYIDKTLLERLIMTTAIRGRLRELADIANNSRERTVERYDKEKKVKIAKGDQFSQWVVAQFWGTSVDRYVSK